MADARQFYQDLHDQTQNFIGLVDKLRTLQDRLNSDASLAAASATAAGTAGRSDLTTVDFTNWNSAVTQLLFTFNSGSPTQKSYLYKML